MFSPCPWYTGAVVVVMPLPSPDTGTEADEKGPEEVTVGWKAGVVRPIG